MNLAATWLLSRANRSSLNVEGAYQHILTDLLPSSPPDRRSRHLTHRLDPGRRDRRPRRRRVDAQGRLRDWSATRAGFSWRPLPKGMNPDEIGRRRPAARDRRGARPARLGGHLRLRSSVGARPGHRRRRLPCAPGPPSGCSSDTYGIEHTTLQVDHERERQLIELDESGRRGRDGPADGGGRRGRRAPVTQAAFAAWRPRPGCRSRHPSRPSTPGSESTIRWPPTPAAAGSPSARAAWWGPPSPFSARACGGSRGGGPPGAAVHRPGPRAAGPRPRSTARAARGRIILASPDPRALRAYLGLGLELVPAAAAAGVPRGVGAPAEVRPGGPDDAALMAEVDHAGPWRLPRRRHRHAGGGGHRLRCTPAAATSTIGRGSVSLLAARDEEAAAGAPAGRAGRRRDDVIRVEWLSADQQWAIRECHAAGLSFHLDWGAVLTDGDVGPLRPVPAQRRLPVGGYQLVKRRLTMSARSSSLGWRGATSSSRCCLIAPVHDGRHVVLGVAQLGHAGRGADVAHQVAQRVGQGVGPGSLSGSPSSSSAAVWWRSGSAS